MKNKRICELTGIFGIVAVIGFISTLLASGAIHDTEFMGIVAVVIITLISAVGLVSLLGTLFGG